MGSKDFAPGDRVRVTGHPFRGHTGTVIGRERFIGLKTWVVELDQSKAGTSVFHGRSGDLQKLDAADDPRQYRT
jgi:hypothetical protein